MKSLATAAMLSFLLSYSLPAMEHFFTYAASQKEITTRNLPTSREIYQLLSSYFRENSQTKSIRFATKQIVVTAFPNDSSNIISFNFFESGKSYALITGTYGQYQDGAEIIRNGEAGFSIQLYPSECEILEGRIYKTIISGLVNSRKNKSQK